MRLRRADSPCRREKEGENGEKGKLEGFRWLCSKYRDSGNGKSKSASMDRRTQNGRKRRENAGLLLIPQYCCYHRPNDNKQSLWRKFDIS